MRKLVNVYSYEIGVDIEYTKDGKRIPYRYVKDFLYAYHPRRLYKTKMLPTDLPEQYCDVERYCTYRECINAQGIIDMKYSWIRENHFMKDSCLRISYTGNLEPYHEEYNYNGKKIISNFISYRNEDAVVFGNDIFKFLAYAHKYSKYDLTEIKSEIIKQCEWLKVNEPAFAPESDDFSVWFDNKINEYI